MTATRGNRIGVCLLTGVVLLFAAMLSGCGEREQVIVYKQGMNQGKADTKPWDNDPGMALQTNSKWTAGDKASWESALRTRAQNQNEYSRAQ